MERQEGGVVVGVEEGVISPGEAGGVPGMESELLLSRLADR